MKPLIHLLHIPLLPIFDQLQLEEALLRTDDRNWCLINGGSSPAIVMGISGDPKLLINQNVQEVNSLPVIRRFSGGGTVVVDENTLFVTFICNQREIQIPSYPEPVLRWTESFYKPLFGEKFRIQENDYALGHKKIGGNAQYFRKGRWLHHSSLLWDYDKKKMESLLMPPKMPKYRESRSHGDFLCTFKEHFSDKKQFQNRFIDEVSKQFTIREMQLKEAQKSLMLPHRQSTALVVG